MLQIQVNADVGPLIRSIDKFAKQVPFATALALTRAAQDGKEEMTRDFINRVDRPTRYTQNSLFIKPATKTNLQSSFGLKDNALIQKSGGYSPVEVFAHHFNGGTRMSKRYERMFRQIGMLDQSEEIVPARDLDSINQFGNVPSSLIIKLLSYFRAFGEQGYRANATNETRAKLAKRTDRNTKGKRATQYVTINGVVYFYSSGSGRTKHLARGIWKKTGQHGMTIKPVLLFVKQGRYRKMGDRETYAKNAVKNYERHFNETIKQAIATARA